MISKIQLRLAQAFTSTEPRNPTLKSKADPAPKASRLWMPNAALHELVEPRWWSFNIIVDEYNRVAQRGPHALIAGGSSKSHTVQAA